MLQTGKLVFLFIFLTRINARVVPKYQLLNRSPFLARREQLRAKRQAFRNYSYPLSIWNDGPISFTISEKLPPHAVGIILKSIKFWQQNTCIDFQQNGKGKNGIDFVRGNGCYSAIGRVWFQKRQELSVGTICEHFHTVTHELAHALGLFHTQSRPDRNKYVTIHEENAYKSQQSNFRTEDFATCTTYDIPYEYGSVMHYRNHEFSANKKATVIPHDPLYEETMGSGTGPSFFDVLLVNKHYNCLDRCKNTRTECQHGGYLHPRNCEQCICPSGFSGKHCEAKEESRNCGGIIYASKNVSSIQQSLGSRGMKDDMQYCHWWIKAPENQSIEVELTEIDFPCWEGCIFGGVEIKATRDKRLTGYSIIKHDKWPRN